MKKNGPIMAIAFILTVLVGRAAAHADNLSAIERACALKHLQDNDLPATTD
jgi:hypothetical protein